VLRAKEFGTYWSGMLANVADELVDQIEQAGRADLVRDFAGPYAARTLKLCSASMTSQTSTCRPGPKR
jgi:hypothetical protein